VAGPLSTLRVLDLADETGSLAGRILADLGADVVKVESPGGDRARRPPWLGGIADPARSLPWLAENVGKRSLTLDLGAVRGRELFLTLVARADVVIETFQPTELLEMDLDDAALRRENARLVWCAITPFGRSGPRAHWRAHDLVAVASGGNLALTGDPDRPPVRCRLPVAHLHAGPEAALGILLALEARERTGRGQLVDVSLQECQLQSLLGAPGQFALSGQLPRRSGARIGRTREIWEAKDGQVSFGLRGGAARIPNLRATVAWMAECGMAPAWLSGQDWEAYDHNTLSDPEIARLEEAFAAFFRTRTRRDLYEEALRRRILLAPCNDAREIAAQPQLRARGFFRSFDYPALGAKLEHPAFWAKSDAGDFGPARPAPRPGEHREEVLREWGAGVSEAPRGLPLAAPAAVGAPPPGGPGILDGVLILELGSGAAGPLATRVLAEHGARVIRLESRRRPDFLRTLFLTPARPERPENRFGLDGSPMFVLLNPNKESVALDLSSEEGRRLARRLADRADVVADNFAPGVMARFGLDAETLRRARPELVTVSGCLFGQTGPQRDYPGFGGQGSAIAGFNHLTGWPDREAHGPYGTITDSLSPRYVAVAVMAALLERRRTGRGRAIDLSQIEAGIHGLAEMAVRFSASGEVLCRDGNRDERAAPHGVYPCRGEDRWIAIAVHSDAEWRALVSVMVRPVWTGDARWASAGGRLAAAAELDTRLAAWAATHDAEVLAERLQAAGVEAGVVQTPADLLGDPQLAARGHFVALRHRHLGELPFERCGFRLSETPGRLRAPGPDLGEHTAVVLGELLGLAPEEIARLEQGGVLA
jgi:crotonobetainyl-CoA:carnitine CoA-transferase CaiB-like acyl-CoA transferase